MRKYEFKPDPSGRSWIDKLYVTKKQRSALLKWVLYGLVCMFLLVVQDVLFSLHLDGYIQSRKAAKEAFIPDFDGTGL